MGASDADSGAEQCEHCQREAIFNHQNEMLCGKHFNEILQNGKASK